MEIAVCKSTQHTGIGRKLVEYSIYNLNPNNLIAETDDEAVDFYRKCGFIISNLGEVYPSTNRYECKYFCKNN